MTATFPKIIWQTHNHKQEWLPLHLNHIAATWVNLNPGWEYRYFDQVQREETVKKYTEIYEVYKYLMPIPQADLWRYIITYEHGGCYADMDSACTKPLDFVLDEIGGDPEMVVVPEHDGSGNNANFIVKANSPLMKQIVDTMLPKPFIQDFFNPWGTFVSTAYEYPNVSKLYNGVSHSLDYKRDFHVDKFIIEQNGKKMLYKDFLDQNQLRSNPLRHD